MEKRSCPLKNSLQPAKSAKSVKIAKLTTVSPLIFSIKPLNLLNCYELNLQFGRKEAGERRRKIEDRKKET